MPNLVGIGLSQVPTNGMLGGMAYQDPEHASIKNLDLKNLSQINSEIADTAVDVFVYDTRKDSDGGAWRKRTQNTSWYNETLGTSDRGTRKEFPAVAVIIVTEDDVIIYDGDDPDLPMWMIFESSDTGTPYDTHYLGRGSGFSGFHPSITSVAMLNGILVVGKDGDSSNYTEAYTEIRFISDSALHRDSGSAADMANAISGRNGSAGGRIPNSSYGSIVDHDINDVAMTVLPNAPIDDATGLPVPTIAVATDGGVSVIRDDGSVVNYTRGGNEYTGSVAFDDLDDLIISWGTTVGGYRHATRITNPFVGTTSLESTYGYIASDLGLGGSAAGNTNGVVTVANSGRHFGIDFDSSSGVPATQGNHDDRVDFLHINDADTTKSLVAYVTTSYNTGWMHGDIKGAFLSDTTAETMNRSSATELVTNGTSWTGASGTTAPNGWTSWGYAESSFTIDSGTLRIGNGAANNSTAMHQNITTVVGQVYTFYFSYQVTNAQYAIIRVGTSNLSGNLGQLYGTVSGAQTSGTLTFVATGTTTNISVQLQATSGNSTINIDNLSVKAVGDIDRSLNNNGLAVFGTVTKTPVATGADLVGYSGFSASNYLKQPYNSSLDFGTGDFSIMFWFKTPSGSVPTECFLHRGDGGTGTWGSGKIIQIEFNSTNLAAFLSESAFSSYDTVTVTGTKAATGQWMHYTLVRSGTSVKAYLNGEVNGTASSSRNLTNTSASTWIGERPNSSRPATTSSLALFRMSASAPSAEQIKKIYEDEKCLFHENAKATLYGSSDAVTALAFDDTTNLLHVGTSAGRSEFQGLSRINNTTDAVTTAISASNGLVAEQ